MQPLFGYRRLSILNFQCLLKTSEDVSSRFLNKTETVVLNLVAINKLFGIVFLCFCSAVAFCPLPAITAQHDLQDKHLIQVRVPYLQQARFSVQRLRNRM